MRHRHRHRSPAGWTRALVILCGVTLAGCQIVDPAAAPLFGEAAPPERAELVRVAGAETHPGPSFQVEIRGEGRQPEVQRLPLADALYTQQVLEQTGVLRRFRRVKVEIQRPLADGRGHRLVAHFDKATHGIAPSSDYAIHPGDRVIITEDRSTIFDDMLESLGRPLTTLGG